MSELQVEGGGGGKEEEGLGGGGPGRVGGEEGEEWKRSSVEIPQTVRSDTSSSLRHCSWVDSDRVRRAL